MTSRWIESGWFSDVYLLPNQNVLKIYHKKERLLNKEVAWLKRLHDFDRTPNYIVHHSPFVIMTYAGERISKENAPKDWQEQIKEIYDQLDERYQCYPGDSSPSNVLVLNNEIKFVDLANYLWIKEAMLDSKTLGNVHIGRIMREIMNNEVENC